MYRRMEQDVCLIGFGEAGATFARAGDWAAAAHIFDIKTNDPATRDAMGDGSGTDSIPPGGTVSNN